MKLIYLAITYIFTCAAWAVPVNYSESESNTNPQNNVKIERKIPQKPITMSDYCKTTFNNKENWITLPDGDESPSTTLLERVTKDEQELEFFTTCLMNEIIINLKPAPNSKIKENPSARKEINSKALSLIKNDTSQNQLRILKEGKMSWRQYSIDKLKEANRILKSK